MKKYAIAMLLVAAPLAAQKWEAGLFLGQQSYRNQTTPDGDVQASSKTVYGARLGYSLVDIGPALFQMTVGYQPSVKTDVQINGVTAPEGQYTHQHYSLGAMFNFKAMVAVGAGLEYRFEKVGASAAGIERTTNYARPWLRANVGYAFPSPIVKPFVGLEVAMPLTSKSLDLNSEPSTDDIYKSLAPKLQVGIYAGIRF